MAPRVYVHAYPNKYIDTRSGEHNQYQSYSKVILHLRIFPFAFVNPKPKRRRFHKPAQSPSNLLMIQAFPEVAATIHPPGDVRSFAPSTLPWHHKSHVYL